MRYHILHFISIENRPNNSIERERVICLCQLMPSYAAVLMGFSDLQNKYYRP